MSNEDFHRMKSACARGSLQALSILAGISPSEVAESALISSMALTISSLLKSMDDKFSDSFQIVWEDRS